MSRIACLFVPDFPLAALQRYDPELRGRPLAVTDDPGPQAPLLAVSAAALQQGIRKGLTVAQARSISASLVLRRIAPAELHAAQAALADVAESFSPRVEIAADGIIFLDVEGLQSLFGAEGHLASSLAARTRRVGLEARVGVASSKTAALLAARGGQGVEVVSPAAERGRLAPLPLALLDPSPELSLILGRWGLRTLGDLTRLTADSVGRRLGPEALRLWRCARGEDDTPLSPRPRAVSFEEAADCEYAIDSFEPLSFLLRGALERLIARLEVRGLRAGDLGLSLRLEDGGREERAIPVAAPTAEVKVLLALLRLSFERRPPRAAVESFRLRAIAERLRPIALDLFAPVGPAPDELHVAIARLAAIAGADRVGRPQTLDSHRPEAFALVPYEPWETKPNRGSPTRFSVLALRAFRPPAPIEVVSDRGHPSFLRSEPEDGAAPIQGRVVALAGPWRLGGEWWREPPLARDYYDVEITSGAVYRIYRDHRSDRWYADGIYD